MRKVISLSNEIFNYLRMSPFTFSLLLLILKDFQKSVIQGFYSLRPYQWIWSSSLIMMKSLKTLII